MSTQAKFAARFVKFSALAILSAAAFSARAENSEAGGGPFEAGAPATVFLTAPTTGVEGDAAQPLSDFNVSSPAIVLIGAPSFGGDDDTQYARSQDAGHAVAQAGGSSSCMQ